ncbi:MAG: tetratricopeptide repeat protein [Bacteroidales bacterium]|jgi:tetratricopeptide (TPR) repeat protein|nr:tetratricopeptide repeat protein [Bacteroidales bacterium]
MATKKEQEIKKGEETLENVETALSKTELWIEEHQKLIYGVIAAIIVIAGIIWGLKALNDKKDRTASNEIFTAQKYFEKEMYDAALVGDGNYLGFTEVYDAYKSTKTGKLAAYYAGISNMKLGKYNEAIDYLKKYTGNDEILAPMALGAIGDCYMELEDMNQAVAYYEKAVNKSKNEFTGPMFLTKAGMTYEILGDYANALKCYKALKADYPLSNEAFEINKNIARIEELMK